MGASGYSKECLTEAARGARTLSEACERLGVDPKSWKRRYIHERMKKLGVDVSHFEREGVKWTREILEPVVAASTSVNEVLRRLGLDVVGGHHTNISRRIKTYGIDISHFTPRPRTERQRNNQRRRTPEEILTENTAADGMRVPSSRLKRALRETGMPEQCALCAMDGNWLGRTIPLEVDHINGNWRDNRVDNLRLLCPNCHSTTDRYRGHGKGTASEYGRSGRPAPDRLRALVAESASLAEVLRRLGLPDSELHRKRLRQWFDDDHLTASHFRGHTEQRGRRSPHAKRPEEVLVRREEGRRTATRRLRRALQEIGVPDECAQCRVVPAWRGRPMTLEIDHINGDWRDNRRENLRLLCPNCHAATNTWCRGGRRRQAADATQ